MENKTKGGLLIALAIIVLTVLFVTTAVSDLSPARFISVETNHPTFSPNEQIRVDYTYKNTWSNEYNFKIEGELDDSQYQYKTTGVIPPATTSSNTMYFMAPSVEGTYDIILEGSIWYSGHWVDGDGKSRISISVVDPKANLIISSNVPNVNIICSNGQTYTTGEDRQIIIENLDLNTEYQFETSKDGYYSETFKIIPIIVDNTYALSITEIPISIEEDVIEDDTIEDDAIEDDLIEDDLIEDVPTNEELIQDNEKITFEMIQNEEQRDYTIVYIGAFIALIFIIAGLFLMRE